MLKLILLLLLVGAAIYVAIRMVQGRGGTPARRRPASPPPRRPLAPDDDPDFLRDLDKRRREEDPG
ncbi:MAG: hypothetical protein U0R80_15145 [Nocardioidaceae bacterium]